MSKIMTFQASEKAFTDFTGRFPVQSSRGNNHVLICYAYDSNVILAEPLKNRSASETVTGWTKIFTILSLVEVAPEMFILDNEISNEFKSA